MRTRPGRLRARVLLGALASCWVLCATAGPGTATAYADQPDQPGQRAQRAITVDHAEVHGRQLRMLVSVPTHADVDLSSVSVQVAGADTGARAEPASQDDSVSRTTVLALDTSNSMRGKRITEAVKAADAYLDAVPDNVSVGLVSFDSDVRVLQTPSRDRAGARAALQDLSLAPDTSLYAGVERAIAATGESGQREVLVLSDGKDTTRTPLREALERIRGSGVTLDVVALQQDAGHGTPLARMAAAGHGDVLEAGDPATLTKAFSAEADQLARQVSVTADVPAGQRSDSADVTVSLTAGGQTYRGSAYLPVREAAGAGETASGAASRTPAPEAAGPGLPISQPVAIGGVVAVGVGLLGILAFLFLGPKPQTARVGLAEQIGSYGVTGRLPRPRAGRSGAGGGEAGTGPETGPGKGSLSLADQARGVAEKVLADNKGLEARIGQRLEGAGMALKPAEWLLLHAGIAIGAGLVGLLLSSANILAVLLFLAIGVVGPWVYLGIRRSRRLAAFNAGLAETLQLMSGSLSAGLSLAQSIDTVVREGTEPIASEFRRVIVEARLGVPLEDALDGVAQRMQSQDFAWTVMAVRIQREVGGNLAELLLNVAATLREREYLRRHVKALSAEGRLSAWILGALPPVFMVYLVLAKPDYIHPLFTTPLGILMCVVALVLLAVGAFWMSKVVKVEL